MEIGIGIGPTFSAFAPSADSDPIGTALRADAIAYWTMNETSGARIDSAGDNDLSPSNNPGSTTGKAGNAVRLVNTSLQKLSRASTADLQVSDTDFYWSGWFRLTPTSIVAIVGKDDPDYEYQVTYDNSNTVFAFAIGGAGYVEIDGELQADTWYFFEVYHDAAGDEIGIALNGGNFTTAAYTYDGTPSASEFRIGASGAGVLAAHFLNGDVDEVLKLGRLPTADERAYLYNSGDGRTLYP